MRFVEVIVVYIILCFLEIVFCTGILSYRKIVNECEAKKMEYSSTKFISESFKNTCVGKGFKNLEEWQKTCRALWKLDYIGWASANEFMDESFENCDELFYGKWIGGCSEGEVFCRLKK